MPADWYFHNPQGGEKDHWIRFMTKSLKHPEQQCFLKYNEANTTTPPSFELEISGC